MKRIASLLFLLTSVVSVVIGGTGKNPKIKSIRTTTYEAVLEDSVWKTGAVVANVMYERFDLEGRKIVEYALDGESIVKSKKIYKYDEDGKVIEVTGYDKDAKPISTTTYEYGTNGKRSKTTWLIFGNRSGVPSEHVTVFTYDDSLRLGLEKKSVNNDWTETRTYKYDNAAGTRECIIKVSSGAVAGRLVTRYDKKGREVYNQSFGRDPGQNMVVTYEYQSDDFGNWIRKDESIDGEKDRIIKRVIDYGTEDTDRKKLALKGNVKSLRQTSYVAIPRGEEILRGKKQGEFADYLFDKEGKIISETAYSETGVMRQRTDREYDEEGRLAKETYVAPSGKMQSYALYTYGKDKRLKAKSVYHTDDTPESKTLYRYDAEGNLTKELTYDRSGKLYVEYDNLYNAYGQLVQRSCPVRPAEESLYNKVVRLYNFQGRVELESVYSPSDSLLVNRSYKYASSGRVISGTECVPGEPVTEYKYKFYNDSQGNWKKRIKVVDGKPLVYEERTYTYFENN